MWLSPANSPLGLAGACRPVSPVLSVGGSYVYTFEALPPLTITTSTPMFDVKSNTWPSAVSRTSIVTNSVPSSNVPSAGSWIVNAVVPAGHVAFPATSVGLTCVAPAVPASAHTRQAAPTTMLTMPAIPRRRRLTSSPMGLCSLVPGRLCPAIPLHLGLTYGHTAQTTRPKRIPAPQLAAGACHRSGHHSKQLRSGLTPAPATHHAPPPNRFGSAQHELAVEDLHRQLVGELPLDHPLEGAGAVGRVVALVRQRRGGGVGDLEADAPGGEAVTQASQLDLDDRAEVGLGQLAEPHDLVDAVDELGLEEVARVARQVGRHDQHDVGEVDRVALPVGEPAVVE